MALSIWKNLKSLDSLQDRLELQQEIKREKTVSVHDKKGKAPQCCICSKKMSPGGIVIEERPTAEDGSMQKWFYCSVCWVELRKLREASGEQQRLLDYLCSSVDLDE